jgi:hypothetical protein
MGCHQGAQCRRLIAQPAERGQRFGEASDTLRSIVMRAFILLSTEAIMLLPEPTMRIS